MASVPRHDYSIAMGKIRIGLSGWSYEEWDGVFYPADLASRDRLAHVAKTFSTVEVNGTFYSLTTPASSIFTSIQFSLPR